MKYLWLSLILMIIQECRLQVDLARHFEQCKISSPVFDECMKVKLNRLNPYFKTGLPDYNISSFDPFFAEQVYQKRRGPFYEYRLVLRNVTEAGWTQSNVTKFKSDLPNSLIEVSQFFPDKRLNGIYEIDATILGQPIKNSGSWNLVLYDYSQKLTISKQSKPNIDERYIHPSSITVICNVETCKNLELHIGNLPNVIENMFDWIMSNAWQTGFIVFSPLVNDLVSTAFTEIFNEDFQYFPFSDIFK